MLNTYKGLLALCRTFLLPMKEAGGNESLATRLSRSWICISLPGLFYTA